MACLRSATGRVAVVESLSEEPKAAHAMSTNAKFGGRYNKNQEPPTLSMGASVHRVGEGVIPVLSHSSRRCCQRC